jgi:hypothetical protein
VIFRVVQFCYSSHFGKVEMSPPPGPFSKQSTCDMFKARNGFRLEIGFEQTLDLQMNKRRRSQRESEIGGSEPSSINQPPAEGSHAADSLIRQITERPRLGAHYILPIDKEQLFIEAYGDWATDQLRRLLADLPRGVRTRQNILLARKGNVLTECMDRLDRDLTGIIVDAGRGRHAGAPRNLRDTIIKHVDESLQLALQEFMAQRISNSETERINQEPNSGYIGKDEADAPKAGKPRRRNPRYQSIDRALIEIGKLRPKSHKEVFTYLDGRVTVPFAEPFQSSRGWLPGYNKSPARARPWLSKAWARLGLPAFPRGRTELP